MTAVPPPRRASSADPADPAGSGASPSLAEAEALADPTRFRLHRILREGSARSVAELSEAVGIHHTAVRAHLARLRDAGLVVEERAAPSGRGRPPMLYRARVPIEEGERDAEAYRRLALLLARVVRTGESPREVGRRAGEAAARERAAATDADAVSVVTAEAERLGFRPERSGNDVVLRNCPFRDVAAADPMTVCSIHLGMAEGLVSGIEGASVTGLVVENPDRAGCRITLSVDDGSGEPGGG